MNKLIEVLFLFCLLSPATEAGAQSRSDIVKEYAKIRQVFADTGYMTFTAKYLYATDKNPAAYLDSMQISMQMHNGNYYGRLKNVEYASGRHCVVSIYKDNQSITVTSLPSTKINMLPLANIDSAFNSSDIDSVWITGRNNVKTIHLRSKENAAFISYNIHYDETSYRLLTIEYSLQQKYLEAADTAHSTGNPVVSILYSNYSRAAFSDTIFDYRYYVKIDSATKQFTGKGKYESFEVFSNWEPDSADNGWLGPVKALNDLPKEIPHEKTRFSGNDYNATILMRLCKGQLMKHEENERTELDYTFIFRDKSNLI